MRTSHLGLLIRIIFSYVHTLHSAAVLVSKICCFVYGQRSLMLSIGTFTRGVCCKASIFVSRILSFCLKCMVLKAFVAAKGGERFDSARAWNTLA